MPKRRLARANALDELRPDPGQEVEDVRRRLGELERRLARLEAQSTPSGRPA